MGSGVPMGEDVSAGAGAPLAPAGTRPSPASATDRPLSTAEPARRETRPGEAISRRGGSGEGTAALTGLGRLRDEPVRRRRSGKAGNRFAGPSAEWIQGGESTRPDGHANPPVRARGRPGRADPGEGSVRPGRCADRGRVGPRRGEASPGRTGPWRRGSAAGQGRAVGCEGYWGPVAFGESRPGCPGSWPGQLATACGNAARAERRKISSKKSEIEVSEYCLAAPLS